MIYLPQLPSKEVATDFQDEFSGYNHNLRIPENQFYDMKNMSGDYYPVLSPRPKRGIGGITNPSNSNNISQLNGCTGVICKDALCYIDSAVETVNNTESIVGRLYINGAEVSAFAGTSTSLLLPGESHVMVSMGAYLLIFRKTSDGLTKGWYYNTEKSSDYGFIDASLEVNSLKVKPSGRDGSAYTYDYISSSEPTGTISNGAIWLDTSDKVHVVKKWSDTQSMWISISTTYVKLEAANIASYFKEGDAVSISDMSAHIINSPTSDEDVIEQLKTLSNTMIVQSVDESETNGVKNNAWIVVIGIIDEALDISYSSSYPVTFKREAPLMDFICEHNNRLWGCRYGLNRNGNTVNEIYACKQGDFKNWFCYAGISTDSYAVSVGSDEVWTGCTAFGSSVLFFKENCIHKIFGTTPSSYQMSEQKVRGIQRGSEKSLCFVNEILFYKSTTDICYYDGSSPVGISSALGEENYSDAVFGSIRNKLYANMKDSRGKWNLFVYDIASQLWYKEDDIHCKFICRVKTDLFYVDSNNKLGTFTGRGTPENDFEWYAETGVIGYSYADNKYVGRMSLRIKKPVTSEFRLLILYDDNTIWEPVTSIGGEGIKSISVPIIPRRCDHFRLRFEGKGDCKIFSLSKTLELGSDF